MSTDDLGLCGRCLIVLNATTHIVARWKAGGLDHQDYPPNPTNPRALKSWAEEKLYGDNAVIDLDAWTDAFRPVATWHGDPVCTPHLYQLADQERRNWK